MAMHARTACWLPHTTKTKAFLFIGSSDAPLCLNRAHRKSMHGASASISAGLSLLKFASEIGFRKKLHERNSMTYAETVTKLPTHENFPRHRRDFSFDGHISVGTKCDVVTIPKFTGR